MTILITNLINAAQKLLARAGVQLVKTSRIAAEGELLSALLHEAALAERMARDLHTPRKKGQPLATGLIFSFNRPLQLELLLRSYYALAQNPQPLIVQFGAKGDEFAAAYAEVAKLYPKVQFVREEKFRDTLLTILNSLTTPKLFFLVDDIVFTRPTDMAAFASLDTATTLPTLRMAPTFTHSYTANQRQKPPSFRPTQGGMLAFTWYEAGNEWAYPMSVDGNLFDTAEVTVMSRIAKAPNTYEGALMRFAAAYRNRTGLCFPEPIILNNPCNKVQTEVANRAGSVTPEDLLRRWQSGERIAHEPFLNYPNTSPHVEVPLSFEPRPRKG